MPLRAHAHIEQAGIAGGIADGAVDIKFLRSSLAGKLAQPPQCHLDIAGAEFQGIIIITEAALIPHLDRTAMTRALLADANAFGIVAISAERAGAAGADPLVAAGMALLLLLKALLERLDQLLQPAQ